MPQRITFIPISSGQLRSYADSEYVTQVLFEVTDPDTNIFQPWDLSESQVIAQLEAVKQWCGYTSFKYPQDCVDPNKPTPGEYFALRLIYLKKLSPGLWEFKTLSKYTG